MTHRVAASLLILASCAGESATSTNDLAPDGPVVTGKGDGVCPTVNAGILTTAPPDYTCFPVSTAAAATMADINRFWGSDVTACSCGPDYPDCDGAYARNGGWVYASAEFLDGISTSGSEMPAMYILAHEMGHEIQSLIGVPNVEQFKELQADCFAGYYLGSLACRGIGTTADIERTLAVACVIGDGTGDPVADLQTHGTCEQRASQVARGMRGYLTSQSALDACAI